MAGVDYRSLEAPAQVDTALPDNGARARAEALRGAFQEFEGLSSDVHNQLATQAGAIAGAAAGNTSHPQYKQGLAQLTVYGRAFNHAATGAYAIQAAAQADATASRLRVEANNDPEHFRTTYAAARDGALKVVPPIAQEAIRRLWDDRLNEVYSQIAGDEASERQALQRKTWDKGIEKQTGRVALLQGSDKVEDQLKALDEQHILTTMIDGGKNSGLYSEAEAQSRHISSARTITSLVFESTFDREMAKPPEVRDPLGMINRFRDLHVANLANTNEAPVFSEAEFDELMTKAKQKLQQQNLIEAYNKRTMKTAEELRMEDGDRILTADALDGKLSLSRLAAAERNKDISPEKARAVRSIVEQGNVQAKSDQAGVLRLYRDPHFLAMSDDEIQTTAHMYGVNDTDVLKAINDRDRRNNQWEGQQWYKAVKDDIDVELKIPKGTPTYSLSKDQLDAQARAHNLLEHTLQDMPADKRQGAARRVAQEVIKGIHISEAQNELKSTQDARQSFIKAHGPGSPDPYSGDKYTKRLKDYDDQISADTTALKGIQ